MCTEGGPTLTGEGKIDTTGQESISECVQRVVQLLQEKVMQIYTSVTAATVITALQPILIFFFEIKKSKITRGHNYTLMKKQSRLDFRKY